MTPDEQARALEIFGWELNLEGGGKDSPLFRRKDWRTTKQEIYYAYTMLEIIEVEIGDLRASRPTWTDARPTEPGWYAWRDQASSPFVIWVGQETIERNKRGELSTWGDGQWARITMPED